MGELTHREHGVESVRVDIQGATNKEPHTIPTPVDNTEGHR